MRPLRPVVVQRHAGSRGDPCFRPCSVTCGYNNNHRRSTAARHTPPPVAAPRRPPPERRRRRRRRPTPRATRRVRSPPAAAPPAAGRPRRRGLPPEPAAQDSLPGSRGVDAAERPRARIRACSTRRCRSSSTRRSATTALHAGDFAALGLPIAGDDPDRRDRRLRRPGDRDRRAVGHRSLPGRRDLPDHPQPAGPRGRGGVPGDDQPAREPADQGGHVPVAVRAQQHAAPAHAELHAPAADDVAAVRRRRLPRSGRAGVGAAAASLVRDAVRRGVQHRSPPRTRRSSRRSAAAPRSTPKNLTYTAVLEQFWELGEATSILLGANFATGRAFDCMRAVPCDATTGGRAAQLSLRRRSVLQVEAAEHGADLRAACNGRPSGSRARWRPAVRPRAPDTPSRSCRSRAASTSARAST